MTLKTLVLVATAFLGAASTPVPAAAEAGDILLRLRGILVTPNEDSGGIMPTFPNEGVSLTDAIAPELDITYMATNHIGFELIAATTKHEARGVTGTTGSLGDLVETWVLPPTLTVQYHFTPGAEVRPYVGAGVNYTIFWDEEAQSPLTGVAGATRVHMSDSFGWALQAGMDIDLNERVFLNIDAKFIDMDTNVRLETTTVGVQTIAVDLDPFVFGIGFGIKL